MALYTPFIEKNINNLAAASQEVHQKKLTSSAYMGDQQALEELYGVNPQLAERIQQKKQQQEQVRISQRAQQQQAQSKQQQAMQEAAKEIAKESANMDYEQAVAYASRRSQELGLDLPPMTQEHHEQFSQAFGRPVKEKSGFEGILQSYLTAEEGSEERKILGDKLKKETATSGGISIDSDGNIQIGGPVKTERIIKKQSQEKIISSGESLARLDRIKDNYDPSFLTYQGKIGKSIASVMSRAGMDLSAEDKKMLRQYRKFTQGVDAEFNAYRKLITGAAAAVSELEDLKKATINTDLSPDEFEAAFNEYSSELSRTIRIRNRILREGITEGSKQYGEELDRLYLTGDDDSMDDRGDELEAQGVSDQDIIKTLEREGYL